MKLRPPAIETTYISPCIEYDKYLKKTNVEQIHSNTNHCDMQLFSVFQLGTPHVKLVNDSDMS